MAIQRLSLAQIETQILEIMGYASSATAPWSSSATLYLRINDYIQRLPTMLSPLVATVRQAGKMPPLSGIPRWDMWLTSARLESEAGRGQLILPEDYDHWLSWYDETGQKELDVVSDVERYYMRFKTKTPGPPQVVEIFGGIPIQSSVVYYRFANVYPKPQNTVKLDITLKYWRIPRRMPGSSASTEYPDIDPKYELLPIYGTACQLMRPTDPAYERYRAYEKEMAQELALTARSS